MRLKYKYCEFNIDKNNNKNNHFRSFFFKTLIVLDKIIPFTDWVLIMGQVCKIKYNFTDIHILTKLWKNLFVFFNFFVIIIIIIWDDVHVFNQYWYLRKNKRNVT